MTGLVIRGGRARLALMLVVLVAATLVVVAPGVRAFHGDDVIYETDTLRIRLVRAEPVIAGALHVGIEANQQAEGADRFKVKADLFLQLEAKGTTRAPDLVATAVTTSYPGSSIPPATESPITSSGEQRLTAAEVGRVRAFDGIRRELAAASVPGSIAIDLTFTEAGTSTQHTVNLAYPLAVYRNDTPAGGRVFPMLQSDLPDGQYWAYGTRHIDDADTGSLQPSTVRDRYAYDFSVVRWDPVTRSWSTRGPANEDLSIGHPVYAVGDGVVRACSDGLADGWRGGTDNTGGGNELWIQHGQEVVRYSHFTGDSIPDDLCPLPPEAGPGDHLEGLAIPVTAGQLIGRVGNTGQSSGGHLHISIHRSPDAAEPLDTSFNSANGMPLGFHNVRIASHPDGIAAIGPAPTFRPIRGQIIPSHSLILANPCGLGFPERGGVEIARHGIHADCFQDVFDLDTQQGWRPAFVDGFAAADAVRFNTVYRPAGPATLTRHGLSSDELQRFVDELDPSWKVHHVDSYEGNGDHRYVIIVEQRSGPAQRMYHGVDGAAHAAALATARADGFVPVAVSAVGSGASTRWTALLDHVTTADWEVLDVAASDYAAEVEARTGEGLRPIHVHGHGSLLAPRLVGVLVAPTTAGTLSQQGLTATGYQQAYDTHTGSGKLTGAVAGYRTLGGDRYAGIWHDRSATSITSGPPPFTNAAEATFAFAADDPWASYECALQSSTLVGLYLPCASPKTYSGLGDGAHTLSVRALDRDGVRGEPAGTSWTVDRTPPEAAIVRPRAGYTYAHDVESPRTDERIHVVGYVVVEARASDAVSGVVAVAFAVDGVPVPAGDVVRSRDGWSFRFEPSGRGRNHYVIGWEAVDGAGNTAVTSISVTGVTARKQ